jgi:hypothetical protein
MGCVPSRDGMHADTGALPDAHEAAKTLDRRRWMTRFGHAIAQARIGHISMVGAHDAAAYNIVGQYPVGVAPDAPKLVRDLLAKAGAPAFNVVSGWARTQDRSILEQLNNGVRYFDIRLAPKASSGDLWVCHGLFSVSLSRVIEDVEAFFCGGRLGYGKAPLDFDTADNKELVILDVQSCEGHAGPDGAAINAGFFKLLEPIRPLCVPAHLSLREPVGALQAAGVRVVVLYPNGPACDANPGLAMHRGSNIRSSWKNKNTVEALKPLLQAELELNARDQAAGTGQNIHVLQGVLTSDTELIVRSLLLPDFAAPDSVEELARSVNDDAMEVWVGAAGADAAARAEALQRGEASTAVDGRNVLMLDFCDRGTFEGLDAVQLCHFLNVRKFGVPPEAPPACAPPRALAPPALAAFPKAAGLLGEPVNLFAPGKGRLLTVWGGEGTPVRVSSASRTALGDIATWYLVIADDAHVALRSASGSFLRVVEGRAGTSVTTHIPEASRFVLLAASSAEKLASGKTRYALSLSPAAQPGKVVRCNVANGVTVGDASQGEMVSFVAYC